MKVETVAQAARLADIDILKDLVDCGHPVDVYDNRGWRPTHEAVQSGNLHCLEFLLHQDATDINWTSHDGITALLLAVKLNHVRIVQLLMSYGADVNIADHMQMSPLLAGNLLMVKLLVEQGADLQCQDYQGNSALHNAVECNAADIVEYLLISGASVMIKDEYGITPVFRAAQSGRLACLQLLLSHAAIRGHQSVCNIPACDQATPTYLAAQEGHTECLQLLCDYGATCNAITSEFPQALPLHAALEFGHHSCAEILVKKTDFNLLNLCDLSPYELAANHADTALTKLLVSSGLSVNYRHKCVRDYRPTVLRYLDCTVRYESNVTAVTNILLNKLELSNAHILLQAGAIVNPTCETDLPPLIAALDRRQYEMVCSLILCGARVDLYHPWIIANMTLVCSLHYWAGFIQMLLCGAEVMSLFTETEEKLSTETKHYLTFDEILTGARIIMRKRGTSIGVVLMTLLKFVKQASVSDYLLSLVDSQEEINNIKNIIASPQSLAHQCRCVIRLSFSAQQLIAEKDVTTLPLPSLLIDYVLHRELLENVLNERSRLSIDVFNTYQ